MNGATTSEAVGVLLFLGGLVGLLVCLGLFVTWWAVLIAVFAGAMFVGVTLVD